MRIILLSILAFLALFSSSAAKAMVVGATDELRGVWVTRFEWPNKDAQVCRNNIQRIFRRASENGFNAVYFQIRGQADVLYPSPYEPWSPLFGWRNPGFDPLAFAIEQAHDLGLEFHAYINAFPVWNGKNPPRHTEPEHLFWTHCQPDSPEPWVCCGPDGRPMKMNEYIYLSPGIPAVHDYLRKIVLDVIQRYDVDGIHLDRIRYPSPDTSHDPVSRKRFTAGGNPHQLSWEDWQRDQVTRMLNHLYAAMLAEDPTVKLSCAVWGICDKTRIPGYARFSGGYQDYYQDSYRWMRLGVVDAVMPMIYWSLADPAPNFDVLLDDFLSEASGRHVYAGYIANYKDSGEMARQIQYSRDAGAPGTVAFASSYLDKDSRWQRIGRAVFQPPAPVPAMPWRDNPEDGYIIGHVKDQHGQPVVDASIYLEDRRCIGLSSADGFFAFLNVPGGTPGVRVEADGFEPYVYPEVPVALGRPARLNIILKPLRQMEKENKDITPSCRDEQAW